MGEIADAVLDGLLDEETGELIDGDAPGYPRRTSETKQKQPNALAFPCPGCGRSFNHKGDRKRHRKDKQH